MVKNQTTTGTESGARRKGISPSLEHRLQESHPPQIEILKTDAGLEIFQLEANGGHVAASKANIVQYILGLQAQVERDQLTDVWSRRFYDMETVSEIKKTRRRSVDGGKQENKSLTMILADIDHFKKINDTYGHHVGDAVLYAVSHVLETQSREYKVARYGGEEFAVIAPETTVKQSRVLGERLRSSVEETFSTYSLGQIIDIVNEKKKKGKRKTFDLQDKYRDLKLSVKISLGAANYTNDVKDSYSINEEGRPVFSKTEAYVRDELFLRADNALYRSKQTGRNKVTVFGLLDKATREHYIHSNSSEAVK